MWLKNFYDYVGIPYFELSPEISCLLAVLQLGVFWYVLKLNRSLERLK